MVYPVGSGSTVRPSSSEMASPETQRNSSRQQGLPVGLHQGADARSSPTTPSRAVPVLDRSKVDPQIIKAAEGMESLFLDFMMKVMRQTVPKSEMDLESPATEIYRGMLDSQTAEKAAKAGGVGLADQMIAYLVGQGYNVNYGYRENKDAKSPEGSAPVKKPHPYAGKEIP